MFQAKLYMLPTLYPQLIDLSFLFFQRGFTKHEAVGVDLISKYTFF